MSSRSAQSSYQRMSPPSAVNAAASPIVFVESRSGVLFRTVLSGVGFMCDAYDLFIMSVVLVVLGCDFAQPDDPSNTSHVACYLPPESKSALATAVLVGSVSPLPLHSAALHIVRMMTVHECRALLIEQR